MSKFQQGDRVVWNTNTTQIPIGEGVVCGVSTTELPMLGHNIIVNVGKVVSKDYPYDTLVVWENWLRKK